MKVSLYFQKNSLQNRSLYFGSCWEAWCLYDWMSAFNFSCLNTYLAFIKCYVGWRITSVQMWNTKVHKMNTYVEHVTSIQIQVHQCSEFWKQGYWIWTHMLNMSQVFRFKYVSVHNLEHRGTESEHICWTCHQCSDSVPQGSTC